MPLGRNLSRIAMTPSTMSEQQHVSWRASSDKHWKVLAQNKKGHLRRGLVAEAMFTRWPSVVSGGLCPPTMLLPVEAGRGAQG